MELIRLGEGVFLYRAGIFRTRRLIHNIFLGQMFDGGEGHYSFLAAVYPTCQPDIFSKAITRLGHKAPTLVGFIMYDRVEEDGPQMSIARAYIGNNTHNGD